MVNRKSDVLKKIFLFNDFQILFAHLNHWFDCSACRVQPAAEYIFYLVKRYPVTDIGIGIDLPVPDGSNYLIEILPGGIPAPKQCGFPFVKFRMRNTDILFL